MQCQNTNINTIYLNKLPKNNWKMTLSIIVSKYTISQWINTMKCVQDLYTDNYKILLKAMNENLNETRHTYHVCKL